MRVPLPKSKAVLAAALGLGLAAAGFGTVPAVAAPVPAQDAVHAGHSALPGYSAYAGSAEESKANQAFFAAVIKSVAEKRAANPSSAAAVTVIYNASRAPSFSTEIARSTAIWNGAVANVKLQSGSASSADFTYREGNDSRGSYASTDGHGSGYVFLDYAQSDQYNPIRITAHETGHVLGLPDHYSGPCSELMSGGGPGPSCTNANPNAAERSRVNQLWAGGFAQALDKVLAKASAR
ncbi:snapalysin [Streptomyces sp. NPDC052287]|uniref:snapalysin n=1 Tax=unclassified Streptomyces TaxID=2593676 RepID=UPI00143E9182|nr:snapalysin [Streptomyces sp. RPA4-2]QIY63745.1 snapalysin [Streptomyces sp. RPA4-2]